MLRELTIQKPSQRPGLGEDTVSRATQACLWDIARGQAAVRRYTQEIATAGHASVATQKAIREQLLAAIELVNWLGLIDQDANLCDDGFDCVMYCPVTHAIVFDESRKRVGLMSELIPLMYIQADVPEQSTSAIGSR